MYRNAKENGKEMLRLTSGHQGGYRRKIRLKKKRSSSLNKEKVLQAGINSLFEKSNHLSTSSIEAKYFCSRARSAK